MLRTSMAELTKKDYKKASKIDIHCSAIFGLAEGGHSCHSQRSLHHPWFSKPVKQQHHKPEDYVNRIGRARSLSGPRPFKPLPQILSPPLLSPMVCHENSTMPLLQIAWLGVPDFCRLGYTMPLACAEFSSTGGLKSAAGTTDWAPDIPYLITFAPNNEANLAVKLEAHNP
ncbi:hypothetical protein VNO77_34517 [Canavalia gladiata]|uniref:Uncharacterized protein n=1 Tax=Canavalia gladiata TaxID=3824 RepID=A0AAN9PXA8_CANGL